MLKPLHELDLEEVLQLLTPMQRDSVLAYARQFARSNLAVSQHGRNRTALSNAGAANSMGNSGEASAVEPTKEKPSESAPNSNRRFIDGRVRKPPTAARLNGTAETGKTVKCAKCGRVVDEADFTRHWETAHPTPKKAKSIPKKMKKGRKKKNRPDQMNKRQRNSQIVLVRDAMNEEKRKNNRARLEFDRNLARQALNGQLQAPPGRRIDEPQKTTSVWSIQGGLPGLGKR
jgi:hypothetical protein